MVAFEHPICDQNFAKIKSLQELIYGLLSNHQMTARELSDCLMSEPYDLGPKDLNLVAIALNCLQDDDFLRVSFRAHEQKLDIEPMFRSAPSRRN